MYLVVLEVPLHWMQRTLLNLLFINITSNRLVILNHSQCKHHQRIVPLKLAKRFLANRNFCRPAFTGTYILTLVPLNMYEPILLHHTENVPQKTSKASSLIQGKYLLLVKENQSYRGRNSFLPIKKDLRENAWIKNCIMFFQKYTRLIYNFQTSFRDFNFFQTPLYICIVTIKIVDLFVFLIENAKNYSNCGLIQ